MNTELLKLDAYLDIFKLSVDLAVVVEKYQKIFINNGMSDEEALETINNLIEKSNRTIAKLDFNI